MLILAIVAALLAATATGQVLALAGFPIPSARQRIGHVDGLRGYLALLVMAHHFDIWIARVRFGFPWGHSSSPLMANFGPGGVTLFFMTTGLVFYPRVLAGLRRTDWHRTYVSRVFRIFPLHWAVLVVIGALSLAMTHDVGAVRTGHGAMALIRWASTYGEPPLLGYADASFINARVLWSLALEWVFYIAVLPVLALLRDLTRAVVPAWVLPVSILALGLAVRPVLHRPAILFFLPLFALGMIAFELRRLAGVSRWLALWPVAAFSGGLLLLAAIAYPDPYHLPQIAAYGAFFACVACGNSFGGIFATRGAVVLGECSFGIYLIHGVVLFVIFTFGIDARQVSFPTLLLCLPPAAITVVLVSACAHLAIERPAIAMGRRLSDRRKRVHMNAVEREIADVAP